MLRKKVKKLTLEFEDGTTEEIEPWNAHFIMKENSFKVSDIPFKNIHFTEWEVRWNDFQASQINGT